MQIGIIGTGRLGLSFALLCAQKGFIVTASDKDSEYIQRLQSGTHRTSEPFIEGWLDDNSITKNISFTTSNRNVVKNSDIIFLFVPTPSLSTGEYDHQYIEEVIDYSMGRYDMDGKILVIGCTVMPGYTQSLIERTGYDIVYNPEFIAQGDIINGLRNADMILIGTHSESSIHALTALYRALMNQYNIKVNVMSPTAAELTKISINCFLTTKIAFANMIGEIAINTGVEQEVPTILQAIGSDSRIGNKYLRYGFGYGGVCVLPTQEIITKRGVIQIQNIRKGDYVLSHDGMFNLVTHIFKRDYDGDMHTFALEGFAGDVLTITPEHPIYACKKPGSRYYTTGGKKKLVSVTKKNIEKLTPSFIESEELQHGDYFVIPRLLTEVDKKVYIHIDGAKKGVNRVPSRVELTPDIMRLFGYWLAEGDADTKHIGFTFHQKEIEFHQDVKTLLKENFNLQSSINKKNGSLATRVRATSQKLARYITATLGKGCDNKKVPYEWLELSDDHLINLLRGMWYGDGSNSTGRFTWATVSKELFTFCKLVLYRLGISFISNVVKGSVRKGVTRKESYYIRISQKAGIETFNGIVPLKAIDITTLQRGDKNTSFWKDDNLFYHIRSRVTKYYKGTVYNIEVDSSNSYMLTSSVVHNCLPRDNKALIVHSRTVDIIPRIAEGTEAANYLHCGYLREYYMKKNPDKSIPFIFNQLSYKKGVDILTESQQYLLCKDLLREGYSVVINESAQMVEVVMKELTEYSDRILFNKEVTGYTIDI